MTGAGTATRTRPGPAVANAVDDGDTVYLAGFGHLIPYTLGHEIIRQGCSDLTLVRPVVVHLADQIVAAGCVSKVVFSWVGGPATERALADGLAFDEYTHYGSVARLSAGARNLPFVPVHTFRGSDLPAHNDRIREVESPYDDTSVPVLPPLQPDVALVHAQRADADGNAHVLGLSVDVRDAVFAAETVVLSVEEVVDPAVIRGDPSRTVIPAGQVDYLVEVPFGAHPGYVHGYYDTDRETFEWIEAAETTDGAADWLDRWVHDLPTQWEYIETIGLEHLLSLRPASRVVDVENRAGGR